MSWSWNPKHWFIGRRVTREGFWTGEWFGFGPLCVLVDRHGY